MSNSAWRTSVPSDDDHDKTSTRDHSQARDEPGTMINSSQLAMLEEHNFFKCQNHVGSIIGYTTSRDAARVVVELCDLYEIEGFYYKPHEIKRQKRAAIAKDPRQAFWMDRNGKIHDNATFDIITMPRKSTMLCCPSIETKVHSAIDPRPRMLQKAAG
jgi:hypothetical protein